MSPHHWPSIGIWIFCAYLCGFLSQKHLKSQWLLSSTEELSLLVCDILNVMFVQVIVNTVQDRCCSFSVGAAVVGRGWILGWLMELVNGLRLSGFWAGCDSCSSATIDGDVSVLKLSWEAASCNGHFCLEEMGAVGLVAFSVVRLVELGCSKLSSCPLCGLSRCCSSKAVLTSSHASVQCLSGSWCISVSCPLPWDAAMTFSSVG